jgi:tetratricopeptide (TPR) repeat protein
MSRRKVILTLLTLVGAGLPLGWLFLHWLSGRPLAEARQAYERGQYAIAARLAEARAQNAADPESILLAARSYAMASDWARAEAYFAQVPLKQSEDFHMRARGLTARGLFSEAAVVYEQILHRWPMDGEALQHIAALRSQEMRDEEALVFAQRLCRVPTHQLSGNVMAGFLEHQMRNYSRAAEHFLKAVELSPDLTGIPSDPGLIFQCLSEALLLTGNGPDAEAYAVRAKGLLSSADPCWHLGRARQLSGDMNGAQAAWEEAIARNPRYVPALQDLGQLHLQRGEIGKALRCLDAAGELEPTNESIQYMLNTARRYLQQQQGNGEQGH